MTDPNTTPNTEVVLEKFDVFLNDVGLDVCGFFSLLGDEWIKQAESVDHPAAKVALQSAGEGVSHAGIDFYVSTK